ncbi:unnamed protein product [Rotaria sordida]|uniref:Uncharacterized protein n=2 Tax=Rotaria sordida TaxID=392033 RepID=A0A815S1Y4_9BILA|nr:unnamed protein product [Rotaria sordida]CAF1483239.1 unnamed protein product [Rotaria sordida]CAF4085177.1 unnamed protein product [Rotaria sordida]
MKRSYSFLNSSLTKRSKIQHNSIENSSSLTSNSLKFFIEQTKNSFINYFHMPPIIFKHQLYSFKLNNRTLIDCELQDMFNNNQIRLFHSDFGIMLMFTNDYHLLIERQLNENNLSSLSIEKNRLKQRFIQDLLPNNIRLSIDKYILENEYQLNSNDIHLLIQLGLLLPKQIDQYWFSIPNLSSFITCLEKGRRTLLQMLSRRMYKEISMNEFRLRDIKKKCLLGFDYHIHDLIGTNLAHIIDAPTGSIVKIGPEKV